jgi:hypothetical protein
MGIQIDVLWQNWLMTMASGLAVMVAVLGGFAAVGLMCGIFREFCTRKEESAQRNRKTTTAAVSPEMEEARAVPAFRAASGLSVVADVQRAIPLTAPGYRR